MLELDLDLEADLGIDTVKQAELIGLIRESNSIARREGLALKDYPTLRHVIRFVLESPSNGSGSTAVAEPEPIQAPAPTVQNIQSPLVLDGPNKRSSDVWVAPQKIEVAGTSEEKVRETVLKLVSEKTGYPPEMLELGLDLEADLGIDTVKQAEIFGMLRES